MLNKTQITATAILALSTSLAFAAPGHDRFPIDLAEVQSKAAERFATMDADGNGTIELAEFEVANRGERKGKGMRHGMREGIRKGARKDHGHGDHPGREAMRAQVEQESFAILDADSDGTVSRAEYADANHRQVRKLARKRAMFKQLDKDGSGSLTQSELPNRAARLEQADTDGDGLVTRDEMRAARQSRIAS